MAEQECGCVAKMPVGGQGYAGIIESPITYCPMHAAAPQLQAALEKISLGEGRFHRDRLQHAINCIEDMREIAKQALAAAKGGAA